jgi:hypothetical protein
MVNNQNNPYLKIFPNILPPPVDDADRKVTKIGEKRLWNLQEIVEIASHDDESNVTIRMVTDEAIKDYKKLLVNGFDLPALLQQLKIKGHFRGAWWCKTSPSRDRKGNQRGSGVWVPCDSYVINESYEHPITGYRGTVVIYLKMCKGLDGSTVLFVSLHNSD